MTTRLSLNDAAFRFRAVPTRGVRLDDDPDVMVQQQFARLRFFGREHVASAFGVPGDWFRGERMVRAGVRIGLVDWVTYDYYPSSLWGSDAPTS